MSQQRYQTFMLYLLSLFWLLLWFIVLPWPEHGWLIVLSSYFIADVGSYILHYIVDFYGDAEKPGVVREFQQHHDNELGIVQESLSAVMYPAAWIVSPLWALLAAMTLAGWLPTAIALSLSVMAACWGYAQLFHRWSHQALPHWSIRWLQKSRLILSPWSHADHHIKPYDSNYAVVNGWSNLLLDSINAPRWIDRVLGMMGFHKRVSA